MESNQVPVVTQRSVSGGAKGPGLFFILPCVDNIVKVDLRTTPYTVPPQEVRSFLVWSQVRLVWMIPQVLTRDSVTVSVDAVVYSRVVDPVASLPGIATKIQA